MRGFGALKEVFVGLRRRLRNYLPMDAFAGNLFIVGAQKAGTTALYNYLSEHPGLVCGDMKESRYFSVDNEYAKGTRNYRSHFPITVKNRYSIDATPEYLYYRSCAERIHAYAPNAKIVILLREPVSRAFSAFNMYQRMFQDLFYWQRFRLRIKRYHQDWVKFVLPARTMGKTLDIEYFIEREVEIINANGSSEQPSLIRRGIYAPQIERYVRLFGPKNILTLFSDELAIDPCKAVNRVAGLIGLPPMPNRQYPRENVGEYIVDASAKELIISYAKSWFEKDKNDLIQTYGLDVPW